MTRRKVLKQNTMQKTP